MLRKPFAQKYTSGGCPWGPGGFTALMEQRRALLNDGFTALLFAGYLLYNTQLMMGGGKSRQVRPDEWLLAAVSIYTDVINMFMAILEIMARQEQGRR